MEIFIKNATTLALQGWGGYITVRPKSLGTNYGSDVIY